MYKIDVIIKNAEKEGIKAGSFKVYRQNLD